MFTFSFLHQKYPFQANLVQKFKIESEIWVPRLSPMCRILRWRSFFSFFGRKTPFSPNLVQETNLFIQTKIWYLQKIRHADFDDDVHFFCFRSEKNKFWANLVQKLRVVCLKWTYVPRLILICRIRWWCPSFLFRLEIPFLWKIWSKKPKLFF